MRKVNIHLGLDDATLRYCVDVNTAIRSITDSVIAFDNTSLMTPHISLVMGTIETDTALETVADIVRTGVQFVKPIALRIQKPYLEDVRGRYVFSDIDDDSDFRALRARLRDILVPQYVQTQSDYTDIAHITLAHVENQRDMVRNYLDGVWADFGCTCRFVGISDVGPKGTCLGRLYRFDLGDVNV